MTCKGNKILGNKEISGTEFAESPLVDGRYPPGKTGNPAGCNAVPIRMELSSNGDGTEFQRRWNRVPVRVEPSKG